MANERLFQFPPKVSPVPADIIFVGDSANAFAEVNSTIAQIFGTYPNVLAYGGLTIGANTFAYSNNANVLTTGTVTALAINLLSGIAIGNMQSTLGYTATPTASLFSGWDINLNLSANNFLSGYTTVVTAAATTTLTVTSTYQQYFTGTTTQTVVLPVTSTLELGQSFYIVNNSTGVVTVESSGANSIVASPPNSSVLLTCILLTGTTAASWSYINSSTKLSFSAYTAGHSNVTGDGTLYTGIFESVRSNIGSYYNVSTGIFTAPITGTYVFTATIDLSGLTGSDTSASVLLQQGGSVSDTFYIYFSNIAATQTEIINSGSAIVKMVAGDTVQVNSTVSGSTKTVSFGSNSKFGGFLVG